jgi:hypothetical protein
MFAKFRFSLGIKHSRSNSLFMVCLKSHVRAKGDVMIVINHILLQLELHRMWGTQVPCFIP